MALWTPSDAVGQNEYIGRRLNARQGLAGAADQARPSRTFELYHFEDKRGQVSFDRLGLSSVDRKVKAYLEPRAQAAATRFAERRVFQGWAVAQAKKLRQPTKGPGLNVVASPIPVTGSDQLTENRYHAHAELPHHFDSLDEHTALFAAMYLKTIFEANYRFEPSGLQPSGRLQGLLNFATGMLQKIRNFRQSETEV